MTKAVFRLLSPVLSVPVLLLLFVSTASGSPVQQDEQASLLAAVAEEQPDLVRRLLEQGADPESRGPDGYTVLMVATKKGHGEIVEILLAHGADPNAQEARYGGTALMLAAESGNLEIVRALLDVGADVNARAEEGMTALLLTMESGSLEVFRLRLEYGADANAPSYWSVSGENDDVTPLMAPA